MKHCARCGTAFTLFRNSVRGEEGLCLEHGWISAKHKPKWDRRGFLAMCAGAAASALIPKPLWYVENDLAVSVNTGTSSTSVIPAWTVEIIHVGTDVPVWTWIAYAGPDLDVGNKL